MGQQRVGTAPKREWFYDTGALEQTSTNTETAVVGSGVDARAWRSLCATIYNADEANTVQWSVYGANASDYSDEVAVQALTDVGPLAAGTYSTTQAPYAYYRIKIHSKVDDAHGACTVYVVLKP